jgi:hypothetical protein
MDLTVMNEPEHETEPLCPGPVPEGETAVAENPSFVSACTAVASRRAAALGWRLGKSILTQSDRWGLIWRIDFQYQGINWPLVNRFVCWSPEGDPVVYGTVTYHENLEPL